MQYFSTGSGCSSSRWCSLLALSFDNHLGVLVCKHQLLNGSIVHFQERSLALLQVKQVFYPGLSSCNSYQYAKDLLKGFGGVVSLELEGGKDAATKFVHVRDESNQLSMPSHSRAEQLQLCLQVYLASLASCGAPCPHKQFTHLPHSCI